MGFEINGFEDGDFSFDDGQSRYVDQPGIYHVIINDIRDGQTFGDRFIDGFAVRFEVLGGGDGSQKHRLFSCVMFYPKDSNKDGGKWLRHRLIRFAIASNLVDPTGDPPKEIEFETAQHQQMVIELKRQKDSEEYLEIKGAQMFHVDDPACSGVDFSQDSLEVLPDEFRHSEDWFESWQKSKPRSPEAKAKAKELIDNL